MYVLSTGRFLKQILKVYVKYDLFFFPSKPGKYVGPKKKQLVEEILKKDIILKKKIRNVLSIKVVITIDYAVTGSQDMIGKKPFIRSFLLWIKDIYS